MNHVTLAVREYLELDVPGTLEEFLHVNGVVCECGTRLGACDADGMPLQHSHYRGIALNMAQALVKNAETH